MRSLLAALVLIAACGKGDKPPPPSGNSLLTQETGPSSHGPETRNPPPSADDPAVIYRNQCAMCHGNTGKGDGISAGALTVKPRDYTDPKWQASITDDDIKKIILLGGKGVGKSPSMPDNPSLQNKPAVLDGLVKIIRGFGGK